MKRNLTLPTCAVVAASLLFGRGTGAQKKPPALDASKIEELTR
jgi:hypothetical protein